MDVSLRITSGPALERAGDLAAILTNLDDGDVLFIDEIHRLPAAGRGGALPGDGGLPARHRDRQGPGGALDPPRPARGSRSIGATTRTGLITGPLRDRFGFIARLDYYDTDDLVADHRARRRASSACRSRPAARSEIARRSRGTPRIANRLLKRVRDYAEVRADGARHHRERAARARAVRGRRARPRQGRPRHPRRAVRDLRRPARRPPHPGGGGGGGAGDGRGGLRAVPAQGRAAAAHAPRAASPPRAPTRTCTSRRPTCCRACSPPTSDRAARPRWSRPCVAVVAARRASRHGAGAAARGRRRRRVPAGARAAAGVATHADDVAPVDVAAATRHGGVVRRRRGRAARRSSPPRRSPTADARARVWCSPIARAASGAPLLPRSGRGHVRRGRRRARPQFVAGPGLDGEARAHQGGVEGVGPPGRAAVPPAGRRSPSRATWSSAPTIQPERRRSSPRSGARR